MLATASLTAASAMHGLHAEEQSAAAAPTEIVAVAEVDQATPIVKDGASKKIALTAAAAGVLAALVKLIGFKRVAAAIGEVGPATLKVAKTAAAAPVRVVKAAASSVGAPVRFALTFAALGLVAFTGIGFFDMEWTAGLLIGGALVGMSWLGAAKTTKAFAFVRRRQKSESTEINQ